MRGGDRDHEILRQAWADFGDPRRLSSIVEVSADVSTNRVYRLVLDNGSAVVAKVSAYGSYYLFREDHDRLHRLHVLLARTRYKHLLADVLQQNGRTYTYDRGDAWVALYEEVERRSQLPRIIEDDQVDNMAEEMALFHRQCADLAPVIPGSSTSIKVDAIHILDMARNPETSHALHLSPGQLAVVERHARLFLDRLDELGYDELQRIPVLIDWNLGNFSVDTASDGRFRLFSRWDYDWFRIDPKVLDFYSFSRVSSSTGDRTQFTYSAHTLLEPRFQRFLGAYHRINPLTEVDIQLIGEAYRFFLLNYVIGQGEHFFIAPLAATLRREAVDVHLPALERFDLSPLLALLD